MAYKILTRDEHYQTSGPKRILSLDGGGLRGILTLGILRRVENILRARHGNDPDFRLCHYFDLIAGTSTGAIIAAALAIGKSVEEVIGHYEQLGREVFQRDWFRDGVLRSRYDENALIQNLKSVFGERVTLGDETLKTGLLVATKRLDTGSPWPLGNNPRGRYFAAGAGDRWISNSNYPLWQVVRASTAAPSYFDPEPITIAAEEGRKPVIGTFVDGGVSPFNNPSFQAFMYATLNGYRVGWEAREDRLLLVSIGTGISDPSKAPSRIAAAGAIRSLFSLMDDCAVLVETVMQWMSNSPTAREIDRELGTCVNDLLTPAPLLTYLRYNAMLTEEGIGELGVPASVKLVARLGEMDNPENLAPLLEIGTAAGSKVDENHFPHAFDLPAVADDDGVQKYVKREDQTVVAVQLALEGAGFTYEKWGGTQQCKAGDWVVNNGGDVYTVDRETFERTYKEIGNGTYVKTAPVWARRAREAGRVETKEGSTGYAAGDYLVSNDPEGNDSYAISAEKFAAMYESAD